jgi:sortase A
MMPLIMATCLIGLTACVRVSVRTHPSATALSARISTEEPPAARQMMLDTPAPAEAIAPAASPAVTPRQAPYLATHTPLPRPTPSPTPTIAPPTPAIPRAQEPPAELVIPSINLEAPVVAVGWREAEPGVEAIWDDPGSAVGWLESSALPGEGSNVVLAGHHNIRGEVFRYLVDVAPGDAVYLSAGNTTYRYVVRERFIIPEKHVSVEQKEQNALWVAPTIDERLTMITCWPYRDNTHRLIVIAAPEPVEPAP